MTPRRRRAPSVERQRAVERRRRGYRREGKVTAHTRTVRAPHIAPHISSLSLPVVPTDRTLSAHRSPAGPPAPHDGTFRLLLAPSRSLLGLGPTVCVSWSRSLGGQNLISFTVCGPGQRSGERGLSEVTSTTGTSAWQISSGGEVTCFQHRDGIRPQIGGQSRRHRAGGRVRCTRSLQPERASPGRAP